MKDKKDKFLIARVPKDLALKFREKSEKEGKRVSEKLRELVEKYIK